MSQFDFIKAEWPHIYVQAVKAEKYARSDARAACVMARLSLEMMVTWIYDHDGKLRRPYDTTLSALIGEPSFKRLAGHVAQKAYLIKNNGNKAAHGTGRIAEDKAVASVRELHHFAYWMARNYSRSGPPTNVQFSEQNLPRLTSVTPQKLAVLQQGQGHGKKAIRRDLRPKRRPFRARPMLKPKMKRLRSCMRKSRRLKRPIRSRLIRMTLMRRRHGPTLSIFCLKRQDGI